MAANGRTGEKEVGIEAASLEAVNADIAVRAHPDRVLPGRRGGSSVSWLLNPSRETLDKRP